jgi:hypothetical protein
VSILKAANRGAVCSNVGENYIGTAAVEAEAARKGTANRTAPIAAIGTHRERTIAVAAVARRRQL